MNKICQVSYHWFRFSSLSKYVKNQQQQPSLPPKKKKKIKKKNKTKNKEQKTKTKTKENNVQSICIKVLYVKLNCYGPSRCICPELGTPEISKEGNYSKQKVALSSLFVS